MKIFLYLSIIFIFQSCSPKEIDIYGIEVDNNIKYRELNNERFSLDNNNELCRLYIIRDSIDCSACEIKKLKDWAPIINYAKESGNKLELHFIFSTSKNNERNVSVLLSRDPIDYPVLIDYENMFLKKNPKISNNKNYHVFVTDKNNKIVMVGSPLYNKELAELFYQTTQKLLANNGELN